MGSNPVAELRHIHKVYGSGDTEVRAVNDLNLTVEAGDYIAVMGASGSGKSTAMNILGCLDRPSSGSYLLQGQQVDGLSDDALAILRNRCGLPWCSAWRSPRLAVCSPTPCSPGRMQLLKERPCCNR